MDGKLHSTESFAGMHDHDNAYYPGEHHGKDEDMEDLEEWQLNRKSVIKFDAPDDEDSDEREVS